MAKYLIVNADDLGLAKGVCDAVIAGAEAGILTDTTAMMCVPDTVTKISAAWPRLTIPVGVHLQLSDGKPISSGMQALCGEKFDGVFPERTGEPTLPEDLVHEEWCAQIELFERHFGRPSHIDSHGSFHRMPKYIETYFKVASRYDLPIRGDGLDYAARARAAGLIPVDYFLGGITLKGMPVEEIALRLDAVFNEVGDGVVELVFHPGYVDEELRQVAGPRAGGRALDLALVTNPAFRDSIFAAGIELIDYRKLRTLAL